MNYADAKKLHNHDQIILKNWSKIATVLGEPEITEDTVTVIALCSNGDTVKVTHKEIK